MNKKCRFDKTEKISKSNNKVIGISKKKIKKNYNEGLLNQNKIKDIIKENIKKKYLIKDNNLQNFNSKYKYINLSIKLRNKITYFIWNLLLSSLVNYILAKPSNKNKRNLDTSSIIYLNVTGYRNTRIIGTKFLIPNITLLNGVKISMDTSGNIILDQNGINNNLTMIWYNPLTNCEKLFQSADTVTEIDLSYFDVSYVSNMRSMFDDCINLKYINFKNINTSSVIDMTKMFSNCYSLTSIDLSGFDTSKVTLMEDMFINCISITYLNLSSFDTSQLTKMRAMFLGCNSLKSIDLSTIDTSKISSFENLFAQCNSLTSLNLSSFITSKIRTMENMFSECYSLKYLDLSKFNTSLVSNMKSMFYECKSLISLNLSNFNTSNVEDMEKLFYGCSSLVNVDLSSFNTTNVLNLEYMFYGCESLISLDLSSFSFNQVNMKYCFFGCKALKAITFPKEQYITNDIYSMFYECSSLESLDLSCFDFFFVENLDHLFYGCSSLTSLDTSKMEVVSATNMEYMFYGCHELGELNLTNWITVYVENIQSMFYECNSLKDLDLSNFDTSSVTNMRETFFNCLKLESLELTKFDTSKVTDMRSMFYGCRSLLELNLSSFNTSLVNNMKSMFFGCSKLFSLDLSNFNTKNVINMASMFSGCKNLLYINFSDYKDGIVENMKDIFFDILDNLVICINNNVTNIQKIISNLNFLKCAIIDCSLNWESKKKKIISETNICIDNCFNNEINKYESNYLCYSKCPRGTHSSKDNKYLCENDPKECIENYPFINVQDNTCAEDCNCEDFFNDKCILNHNNPKSRNIIIMNIIKGIEDGLMDKSIKNIILKNKKDIIKIDNNTLYQITSSLNQKNNNYQNISLLNLGECEILIKEKNYISNAQPLIIFKIEEKLSGLISPLIEYEIYNSNNKNILDLEICNNANLNITIDIPAYINENYSFKYDPNNSFYNDICYTYTTENLTDITLYDRKNEYNNNNFSICPFNCFFISYDIDSKKVKCQCKAKRKISLSSELNNDQLKNNFIIKKSITNFKVFKCFKLLFSKEGLLKNIGSYLIITIIIVYLISVIYFYSKGYNLLCEQINDVLNKKILEKENEICLKKLIKDDKENLSDLISSSKISGDYHKKDNNLDPELSISKGKIFNNKVRNHNEKIDIDNPIYYLDYEINTISYEEAIKNDKRTFFQYYISLLKINHVLIFTFNRQKDYNSYIIKLCLFFFSIALYLVINIIFFNDSAIHKIYEDKGSFNFIYFLPQIIYSIIICSFIISIIKIFSLSQKNILQIKHEKK